MALGPGSSRAKRSGQDKCAAATSIAAPVQCVFIAIANHNVSNRKPSTALNLSIFCPQDVNDRRYTRTAFTTSVTGGTNIALRTARPGNKSLAIAISPLVESTRVAHVGGEPWRTADLTTAA